VPRHSVHDDRDAPASAVGGIEGPAAAASVPSQSRLLVRFQVGGTPTTSLRLSECPPGPATADSVCDGSAHLVEPLSELKKGDNAAKLGQT
jgi:hypothetical protein